VAPTCPELRLESTSPYNADLSTEGLATVGLDGLDSTRLRRLDSFSSVPDLEAVGRAVVERDLRREHYEPFL
jgi:hypothetical protein